MYLITFACSVVMQEVEILALLGTGNTMEWLLPTAFSIVDKANGLLPGLTLEVASNFWYASPLGLVSP